MLHDHLDLRGIVGIGQVVHEIRMFTMACLAWRRVLITCALKKLAKRLIIDAIKLSTIKMGFHTSVQVDSTCFEHEGDELLVCEGCQHFGHARHTRVPACLDAFVL